MKPELNYKIDLSSKSKWWCYYGEYKYFVDFTFRELKGGEITGISIPFAFCIRHTLELGYKTNLIELEKISEINARIKFNGKAGHKIDSLHKEFLIQMRSIFKKFPFDNKTVKQFENYSKDLSKLTQLMHKLDELSYSFRYPVKNDGVTPNFNKGKEYEQNTFINFKEIKELYDTSIVLLTYSTAIIAEVV